MSLLNSFLTAFSALLALINPPGTAFVFVRLIGDALPKVFRSLARRITINNVIFLVITEAEILGAAILNFFSIFLPIAQLSGDMVIAAMRSSVLN